MAFTIEGKSGTEWLKAAKARQAKGQYDDTGAREAIQRMQGRRMPEYDKNGQRVIGGSGTTYNYQPPAKKAEPAKPAPKPEARQTAAMPKPASHASPAKAAEPKKDLDTLISSTQDLITKARAPEAPKKADPAKPSRPAPGQAKGTEAEWTAKRDAAKQAGRVRSIVRRSEDEGRSSLHRLQAEARAKSAADSSRKRQRESDEWEAKNAFEKVGDATVKHIEKPAMKAVVAGGKAAVAVGSAAAGYLSRAGRWLGGDSDARRRLQSAK
jgi:hypothetical protein